MKDQRGYTLIELIVVMLVTVVLALSVANFIANWLGASSLAEDQSSLLNNAERALDLASNDIELSGSVDATPRWSDPNAPSGGWTSNSSTLILAKVAVDSSNNPIFLDSSDYITQKDDVIYYLSGTTLYRRILASTSTNDSAVTTCPPALATASCPADTTIATNVSSWSVSYYDANNNQVAPNNARSIQLAITVSGSYGSKPLSASYSTRMVFRND